jgi:hypothetical protein
MIRKLVSKLSKSVNKRVVARRHDYNLSIKISFEVNRNTGSLQMPLNNLSIRGETKDMSNSGIAFVVSSIRLQEYYLVGDGHTLNAELDLPNGKVQMRIMGQRYEQIGKHISTTQYLVGAKILSISETDLAIYKDFLKNKKQTGSLKLVDER